jgi:hypothetical protein
LDPQGAAGILPKSSDERKRGEAFPQSRSVGQNEAIPLDVVHRRAAPGAPTPSHALAAWRRCAGMALSPAPPSELASVPMLSALLRAAFSVSAFLRVELCWSRARIRAAAPRRRVRAARGWLGGGGVGQAPPPDLLITRAKNIFELKTRGVLGVFSFSDLLQQPVMPMISIHIFARGKSPRTATTGANTKQGVLGGYKSVRLQQGVKHPGQTRRSLGRGVRRGGLHAHGERGVARRVAASASAAGPFVSGRNDKGC